jgi:hypothetical protein
VTRCVDCHFYPWVPEAEADLLPAHRCHPELPLQRWTEETKQMNRDCLYFRKRKDEGTETGAPKEEEKEPRSRKAGKK